MDVTPEEYERVTEVTYLGQVNGTRAALKRMLPRNRGRDRAGRLGPRLSRHPAPVGLLRRQARHPGIHRFAALRAYARKSRSTITMVQMPGVNTPQFDWIRAKLPGRRARSARSTSRRSPRARSISRRMTAARRCWSACRRSRRCGATSSLRALMDDYLAATGFDCQQGPSQSSPDRKDNLFEPVPAITARTAASMTRRWTAAPSFGSASTSRSSASPRSARRRSRAPAHAFAEARSRTTERRGD